LRFRAEPPGFAFRARAIILALSAAPDTGAVCPYLLADDGSWRASSATRDHRCHAVAPAAILAPEKQRRLCLVAEHVECSTYLAAVRAVEEPAKRKVPQVHRPVTKTAPLVLDRGRIAIAMPGLPDVGIGQSGLVALMAVAFGALVVTRLGAGGPGIGPGAVGVPGSPEATIVAPATSAAPMEARPTGAPERTLVPSDVEPTKKPAATSKPGATPRPTAKPTAGTKPGTYKVQTGDTLSGIASAYGTTWQVLAELNGIRDPRALRVGQVLELP
jgi:LysM repeat protein